MINVIKKLFDIDELHQVYQENGNQWVLDATKENDTVNITVKFIGSKDKEQFENWLKNIDDDLFTEVLEELQQEGLYDLDSLYNSEDYQTVIDKVKQKTKQILQDKVSSINKILESF